MNTIARKLYQRVTNFTFAFILAVSSLTAAMPFIFSQNAAAVGTPAVVYDALPSVVPSTNYPSYGLQAHSIQEFGDRVLLSGSNRVLDTVTVTMSNWAKFSSYSSNPTYSGNSSTWTHPITLNVYDSSLNLLATTEQSVSIPWRPESNPDCGNTSNGQGWKEGDTCYNYSGIAFNATFNFSSQNVVLPSDIILSVEYDTQTRGDTPLNVAGPYNSLNITFPDNQVVSVGSDQSAAMAYADASWNNGFGSFSEFETLPGNGTVAFRVTALPVDTTTTVFVNDPKYVRANNGGDLTAQLVTPDLTEDVRFFVDGDTSTPLSGTNVGGAGATTSWWRLYTPLAAGAHDISAEIKVGGVWYAVDDTTVTYSLDTPTGSYVYPSADRNVFRSSDSPVRIKADDEFEQFSKARITIAGVTYEVMRNDCDLRAAGNYVLCDVSEASNWGSGLGTGTYTAVTSIYTKANNRLDNLTSQSFQVDGTAPVITDFTAPTSPTDATFTVSAKAEDPDSGIESVNFYITAPRESDGLCTGNGTKLYESRDTVASSGVYAATFNAQLTGEYCVNASARNNAMANSTIVRRLVTIDAAAPQINISNLIVSSDKKLSFDLQATDAGTGLDVVAANIYNENNTGDPIIRLGKNSSGGTTGNTRLNEPYNGLAAGTTTFTTSVSGVDVSALESGTYTIRAYARDHVDNELRFLLVRFEVDNTDPVVTITGSTTATATPTIIGTVTGDEDNVLTLILDGTSYSVTADASGNWSFTSPDALENGIYLFTASATDEAGNTGTASANVTVAVITITEDDTTTDEDETETETQTIVTPIITPPSANGDQDVQGATDENDQGVEGSAIETPAQVDTDGSDGTIFGLAWYWWIAIIAGLAAITWGIIAALRRRQEA